MTDIPNSDSFEPSPGHLRLGRLGRPFGLAGGMHFHAMGRAEAAAIFDLDEVFVRGFGPAGVADVRPHGSGLVLFLDRVRRVERAREWSNALVYAPAEMLPEPEEGSYYVDELLDLPVLVDGAPFGTVIDLAGGSGNDLLVVEHEDRVVLLPLHAPYVQVGLEEITVSEPPEGLLEQD